ncbi:MAG: dicarboxylate/amino acid:cation symporter [Holosporales bacterium]|jgi:Na+/H+-dicarboxylate symporter|nr:dicarboxylate/amino acid:cation symporter [Holosporales bacterium]
MSGVLTGVKRFGMPLAFFASLIFPLCFGWMIPCCAKSFVYAVSLAIKELLIFSLPFAVGALIFNSISRLGIKALGYAPIIIGLVCASNFINTILSYLISAAVTNPGIDVSAAETVADGLRLLPGFTIDIGTLVSNDVAIVCGASLGLLLTLFWKESVAKLSVVFGTFTKWFFKCLMPLMPIFIMVTALKLQHDGMITKIFQQRLPVLFVFIISAYGYVVSQFFLLSLPDVKRCFWYMKNALPALIAAFGSMSSAAAMPLSIKAAEKNTGNCGNADIIIPATVNIHLVGDCFFLPLVAISVMTSLGMSFPGFCDYLPFAIHFVLAKFAVAAVPGGGVLVMIPVMQKYLGMSSEALALVTALYALFDPVITACNVAGNGAMAIIFEKVAALWKRNKRRCQ